MRKIAIALTKGGTGKTTTAVNIAGGLAQLKKRVLLIDLDTQGQAGASLLADPPKYGISEFLMQRCTFQQALTQARENLFLLAGGRSISQLQAEISRKEIGGEHTLRKGIEPHESRFDYILLDVPPGFGPILINAFFYCRELLVPAALHVLSLQSLVEFHHTIDLVQEYNTNTLEVKYIVPTFYESNTLQSAEILEQLRHVYGQKVCDPIRKNVRLSEAPGHRETIWEYAGTSAGAEDYAKLIERILQDG